LSEQRPSLLLGPYKNIYAFNQNSQSTPTILNGTLADCPDDGASFGGATMRGCGGAGGRIDSVGTNAKVFRNAASRPILGLRVVNNKLTGTVAVWFSSTTGKPLTKTEKTNILRQLRQINQTEGKYGIDLNFVEANTRTNPLGSKKPYIMIEISDAVGSVCEDSGSLGCYIDDLKGNYNSRRLVIPRGASDHTVTHEFGHYLGFGHNNQPKTLMYEYAPAGGYNWADRQLRPEEIKNIVNEYKKIKP
jgi:hypothetical protein